MVSGQAQPHDDSLAGQTCDQPRERPLDASEVSVPVSQLPASSAGRETPDFPPATSKPINPFYGLLLVCSVAFVLTGLVLALVPWPELPAWLQKHGWKVLLGEMALVMVTGLASMALDRWRS